MTSKQCFEVESLATALDDLTIKGLSVFRDLEHYRKSMLNSIHSCTEYHKSVIERGYTSVAESLLNLQNTVEEMRASIQEYLPDSGEE